MSDKSMAQTIGDAIREFRQSVPDCLAAGIIDLSTGMLLDVSTVNDHPTEILNLLAGATFDIFQGRNVVMIEHMWNQRRGLSVGEHYFQEILINSNNMTHLFMRSRTNPNLIGAVICGNSVNLGMLFAQSRLVMTRLDRGLA